MQIDCNADVVKSDSEVLLFLGHAHHERVRHCGDRELAIEIEKMRAFVVHAYLVSATVCDCFDGDCCHCSFPLQVKQSGNVILYYVEGWLGD